MYVANNTEFFFFDFKLKKKVLHKCCEGFAKNICNIPPRSFESKCVSPVSKLFTSQEFLLPKQVEYSRTKHRDKWITEKHKILVIFVYVINSNPRQLVGKHVL